jgi:hypothetical protein
LSNVWLSPENCCENTTDDFVENRKNRVRLCRNRLHWTIQEKWNKIIFSDENVVLAREKFTSVCMVKSRRKVVHVMFRTVYGSRNGGGRVSNVLGCICKDGVGTITEVEGNINSTKCMVILDNNLLPVVLKFKNYQWISPDDSDRGTPVRTDKIVER